MHIHHHLRIATVSAIVLGAGQIALAATHTVNVGSTGFNFDPQHITVAPGDTVEWIHVSGSHTVTSGTSCTPDGRFNNTLPPGGMLSYVIPANEPNGVIPYYCIPHCLAGMTGSITVAAPVPAASTWGLLALSILVLSAGTVLLRKGRPTS